MKSKLTKRIMAFLTRKDKKKLIENTVIVIIIGVIAIIAGSSFFNRGGNVKATDPPQQQTQAAVDAAATSGQSGQDSTEEKLKSILSLIQGAGKVDVMITYEVGKENIPAYDTKKSESTTAEKDSGGGTRNLSQSEYDSTVVYEDAQGGGKKPVIVKEIQPVVKGVLVVADGASDPIVRKSISDSVQVLLGIPIHKVKVVERKR